MNRQGRIASSIAIATMPGAASPVFAAALEVETTSKMATANSLVRTQSGARNGLSWTAASRIIGQTPTSNILPGTPANSIGGGDPIYKPSSNKSGVVALIMERSDGTFICSGSLLSDRKSIATAGHCVSDGAGTANPIRTTAYFYEGDPDTRTPFQQQGVAIDVTKYFVNSGYTGEVIDQNDIAVLRLSEFAPESAQSYRLARQVGLTGEEFNVAGYGGRSTIGGAFGTDARTGWLREGDNIYDYALGNSLFDGFFTDRDETGQFAGQNFFGFAEIEFSYISDFDNGLAAQSQATRVANGLGLGPIGTNNFADLGLGAREVNIAGGDSGGPGFVNGELASINSYGLSFGTNFGDFRPGLNSSWGELSGYVPIYIHRDFILSSMVPEPGTWAMLIAGFGLVGGSMRRRRMVAVA
ncbi:hypothetical protein GCM10007973_04790 [Polymorphobacter multimanifer]|nr:hypothetical protein GCM10007973_04790 [Polymorphobacter multimanifer]